MKDLFRSLPGDEGLPADQRARAFLCVVVGIVLCVLDQSIVNVALPVIAQDLGADAASTIWVANAYQIATAISILAFVGLAGFIGLTRVFLLGLFTFTASSIGCALAASLPVLVGFRFVQGLGAGAVMAVAPALYRLIFPNRLLGTVIGMSAFTVAASLAAGPSLGGLILAVVDWPWLFAVNLPIGALGLWMAWQGLPRRPGRSPRFDAAGALSSAIGMGAMVVAVDQFAHGAGSLRFALLPLTAVAAFAIFCVVERRAPYPLLPLDIFGAWRFSSAVLTSILTFSAQGLAFVALPFLFQDLYGYSALGSGLLFTPWPLAIMAIGPLAGRWSDRLDPLWLTSLGLILFGLGLLALARLGPAPAIADILWRSALCGIGFGLYQAPNNREMMGSVPRERAGAASGVIASARTFGQALGTAVTALVMGSAAHAAGTAGAAAVHEALSVAAAIAGLALIISLLRLGRSQA